MLKLEPKFTIILELKLSRRNDFIKRVCNNVEPIYVKNVCNVKNVIFFY